ncbi:MAG: hypothetical protein Q9181_001856, partial [Wetmoreana brouardii]
MIGVTTPRKADEEIRRIITDLSAQWGLRFPPPGPQSPAKRDLNRPEEKALDRIRYLFFYDKKNDRAATKNAINCFEQLAPKLLAGWISKPSADEDVLPSRTRSATNRRATFLSRTFQLSDEQACDLMQALLRYLDETIEAVRKGAVFAVDDVSRQDQAGLDYPSETTKGRTPQSVRRSSRTLSDKTVRKPSSEKKNGNIRAYLKQLDNDPQPWLDLHKSKDQQPSSDDFKIDDELFADVDMVDAPSAVIQHEPSVATEYIPDAILGTSESTDSFEEHYQTPPDTPSKIFPGPQRVQPGRNLGSPSKIRAQTNANNDRSANSLGLARKRSFPEMARPDMPRKISRDNPNGWSAGANKVQAISSTRYIDDLESRKAPPNGKGNVRSFQKSSSTGSLSSGTSSAVTQVSSAWTTPNTSFIIETPATSFNSAIEPYELEDPGRGTVRSRPSWQNLKAPFGLGLDFMPMGPPALVPKSKVLDVSVEKLLSISPFSDASPKSDVTVHLRQLYELCRVSTQTKIPLKELGHYWKQAYDDYKTLWSNLATVARKYGLTLPERSSLVAWERSGQDFRGVALTGSLVFAEQASDRVFEFKLNPLKIEPTYRLARKFGSDRFFILSIPSIESKNLPINLRSDPHAREAIVEWLVNSEHLFLGRKWRTFYVKRESNRKLGSNTRSSLSDSKYRVYLFAESCGSIPATAQGDGRDPKIFAQPTMTRKQLIDWFMPAKANRNQPALKFFTRLAIGVSPTAATIQFRPVQIIRSDDARANAPGVRRLRCERSDEKKTQRNPVKSDAAVMNDGCARVSKAAARAITELLHLDYVPSIFQGRISGAKGVWMVDALGESIGCPNGDFWIEITDSQLKFDANSQDEWYPDPERVTFEVLAFSRPLTTANLNYQLMPILAERKVPFRVFEDLLEADLTAKVAELQVAMESGLAIRKWNQDVNSASGSRNVHGVEMHGGLPINTAEEINWFVEDILYSAVSDYCCRLENRMNIEVAKSTYAFMIADPLAVLEEGEVHISFSKAFDDENMLHDIDLLVARLPAALPSDIQKVRAVFKVELRRYRDVIVFSSKGARPLADKLSGGDYDGDRSWICWEPIIVDPFENAPVPEAPLLESYGIETDKTMVTDFLSHDDYTDRFLRHAFDFTLKDSLLGICTSYFENLCYSKNNIPDPSAIKVAHLLGFLVDSAKAGIIFTGEEWNSFLQREGLPRTLAKPAYKDKKKNVPARPTHLIDRLVFVVAKGVQDKALGEFSHRFKDVGTYDSDLTQLHKLEQEEAKRDKGIAQALQDLKSDLNRLRDYWAVNCANLTDDSGPDEEKTSFIKRSSGRGKSVIPFAAIAEHVRDGFLALQPSADAIALSPIVARWSRESSSLSHSSSSSSTITSPIKQYQSFVEDPSYKTTPAQINKPTQQTPTTINHWTLLKASTAFSLFHSTKNFIWYAAGPELGLLKAHAKGMGG